MPSKTPLGMRLRELRRSIGDPDRDVVAKALGIGTTTLGNYEKGISEPTVSVLDAYRKMYGANISWIMSGEGPIFLEREEYPPSNKSPLIDGDLLLDIKACIEAVHKEHGISLPSEVLDRRAIKHYNEYMNQDTDASDYEESMLWLSLLRKRLEREVRAARASPGTGKREAS